MRLAKSKCAGGGGEREYYRVGFERDVPNDLVHKILYKAFMSLYGVLLYGVYGDGLFGAAATHTANIYSLGVVLLAVCVIWDVPWTDFREEGIPEFVISGFNSDIMPAFAYVNVGGR